MAYWPDYFAKNGLAEPKELHSIPLGLATGYPDLGLYGILDAEPKLAVLFNRAQAGPVSIYSRKDVYDFSWMKETALHCEGRLALVDVGGGSGLGLPEVLADNAFLSAAQCAVFDLPKTIEGAKSQLDNSLRSVQLIGGTMFEPLPQAAKGALVYQFRRVLSDFPDDNILQALERVREACVRDSRVLVIEELVRAKPIQVHYRTGRLGSNFGGKRRSEAMFRELATRAGFRVNALFEHPETEFGILELVLA